MFVAPELKDEELPMLTVPLFLRVLLPLEIDVVPPEELPVPA